MDDIEQELCETLIAFLKPLKGAAAASIDDDTLLLSSGLVDSLVLLQLSIWIEEQVGGPVNPAEYNLAEEWATVASTACFVKRLRDKLSSNG